MAHVFCADRSCANQWGLPRILAALALSDQTLKQCQICESNYRVALGGWGLFGVELFIEVSPDGWLFILLK
jgi:hypothetical protein